MALEALFNVTQQSAERKLIPEHILRYKAFIKPAFYDTDMSAWIESIWYPDRQRKDRYSRRTYSNWTTDQLWGVLALSTFDRKSAWQTYMSLKSREFYDPESGLWNYGRHEELGWNRTKNIYVQQIGILSEALFNKDSAQRIFERLQIQADLLGERLPQLDIIIKALFDKHLAKSEYESLPKTNDPLKHYTEADSVSCTVELIGILADAVFNPEIARNRFEALKQTPLYDKDRGLWFRWMRANTAGEKMFAPDVCDVDDQFLSIIIEYIFSQV